MIIIVVIDFRSAVHRQRLRASEMGGLEQKRSLASRGNNNNDDNDSSNTNNVTTTTNNNDNNI